MKKKLVCILLCAVMLVSAVMSTGCSLTSGDAVSSDTSGTEENGSAVRTSMTLSLWVPVDESTTEEALYLVEAAINSVTQSEFDTAIKLYGIPESEYDAVMKDRIKTIEQRIIEEEEEAKRKRQEQIEAAQRGETLVEETTEYVNPNMDGDYSLVVRGATGYTNLERNQLDIFLIHGMDDYRYYVDNLYVQTLNEELSGSSKVLNNYIFADFFEGVKVENNVYAIPNNHAIGEGTYFLVNKDIVESEYLDPDTLTSLETCESFINDVAAYYPGVVPVYGEYSPSYYQYWNGSGDISKFSVLASRVYDTHNIENVTFNNIFSENNFTKNYALYKSFKEKGYVSTSETVPEKFGVGYITCTEAEIQKYAEDYYITDFKKPMGTAADYTQAMFAVSSFSKSVPRSMEIITLLNTSSELRTILQYGAEGTHWKYDEENEDIIVKLDNKKSDTDITYKMNLFDTGNVYMTNPDFGKDFSEWEYSKEQNLKSYFPATYYYLANKNEEGTGPVYYNTDNEKLFQQLDALSADIYARMEAMTAEEFTASISALRTEVANSDVFKKLTYMPSASDQAQNKTPDTGWIPEASLVYQWEQYCISVYGEEAYNNLKNAG